jgi:hypothetical protein
VQAEDLPASAPNPGTMSSGGRPMPYPSPLAFSAILPARRHRADEHLLMKRSSFLLGAPPEKTVMFSLRHGESILRYALMVGMTLVLAGCASETWTAGPDVNPNLTLEQQRAQCTSTTSHNGSVGEAGPANMDFNTCMRASGWLRADRKCRTPSDSRLWLPTCE